MIEISLFNIDIINLKNVGPKTVKFYKHLGINSIGNFIMYFPFRYEDWGKISTLEEALNSSEPCVIKIRIINKNTNIFFGKKKMYKIKGIIENQIINIIFLNKKNILSTANEEDEFLILGKICRNNKSINVISPKIKDTLLENKLEPIYHQCPGLPSWMIAKSMKEAIKLLPEKIKETLPNFLIIKFNLASLEFMIKKIHFPLNSEELHKAKRRLFFEELLIWKLSMYVIKNNIMFNKKYLTDNKKKFRTYSELNFNIKNYFEELKDKIPFSLTYSQERIISECIIDMKNFDNPMRRFIQGDVGSGKTIIAMVLSYNVIRNNLKVVLMVPSEILAFQHYERFLEMFKIFFNCEFKNIYLITKSNTKKQKKDIYEILKQDKPLVLIGTHSLISDELEIRDLALVIIDEQHKFGVNQRFKLISKSFSPHVLMMSATPIPRSLAFIMNGCLNISFLKEMPPGRKKIKTFIVSNKERNKVIDFLKIKLNSGSQCFIVCSAISESEELISLENYKEKYLPKDFIENFKIELINGKMKKKEKEKIMDDFRNNKINILISTSIIEVGIDVTKATIIIIENPEKFGLASLHQLRGRVGRGNDESYCILISDLKWGNAYKRLKAMEFSSDGFYLANQDLKQRGPGDFFGTKQHGEFNKNLSEAFENDLMLNECKNAFKEIIEKFPNLDSDELNFIRKKIIKLIKST